MECAECGVRSAVGYCNECETLLCEVCGRTCERCGKVACRGHLQRTSSGRTICVACVVQHYDNRARQTRELRERRAEETAMGGKTKKHRHEGARHESPHKRAAPAPEENFSFESLSRELGAAPVPFVEHEREPEPEARRMPAGARDLDAPPSVRVHGGPLGDPDALNARVLTGSASTRTPPWLSGLMLGVVSWALCFLSLRESAFAFQQWILGLVALVVSLGTVVWTVAGAFGKEPTPARTRCRVAFGLGLGAFVLAVWIGYRNWS